MPKFLFAIAVLLILNLQTSKSFSQLILAHRGASYDAPENTVTAFRLAFEQQADGIEGDFYFTKDRQIVCIHDADTERTGGAKRVVADSTLAELRELEYGSWKAPKFKGEPIPTFAEVCSVVPPGKWFVIELKTGPEIVPLLRDELRRLNALPERLLIISFYEQTVLECKQQLKEIRTHWLTGYKQDKPTGLWRPTDKQVLESLRKCQADGLGTQGNRESVTADFLSGLRSQGMKEFHVWTVDEPADARFFRDQGALGITTNRPAFIRSELAKTK